MSATTNAIIARTSRLRSSSRCEMRVPSARFSFVGSSAMVVREHHLDARRLAGLGGFYGGGRSGSRCPRQCRIRRLGNPPPRAAANTDRGSPGRARCHSSRNRSVLPDAPNPARAHWQPHGRSAAPATGRRVRKRCRRRRRPQHPRQAAPPKLEVNEWNGMSEPRLVLREAARRCRPPRPRGR